MMPPHKLEPRRTTPHAIGKRERVARWSLGFAVHLEGPLTASRHMKLRFVLIDYPSDFQLMASL